MRVMIFGAGRVGGPMAIDLSRDEDLDVQVADFSKPALESLSREPGIRTHQRDLSDPASVRDLVKDADIVVNAGPSFLGFQTYQTIIEAGRNVVDIAFFPEDPFPLDQLAKEKGVTAVMDAGVAPGISNLLVGHVDSILDRTDNVEIYVGGLPQIRHWPYEYRAGFSPIDVIEEYTRPARYVENGGVVTREALSEPELFDFPGVGTLEAFNTDGLRTLMHTIKAPNMKEKTLRYPGHINKMIMLRRTGFFGKEPIDVNGQQVVPLEFTARLLFPMWEMKEDDRDLTVMELIVEGEKAGKKLRYTYEMLDKFDENTQTTSMARTTGYAAATIVRLLAKGLFKKSGVMPLEFIGRDPECVGFVTDYLRASYGIDYRENIENL